jgi:hypothetical protein
MKPVQFFFKNKIITIIISVSLLILILGIAGNYIVQNKYDNWPEQNQKNITAIISSVDQTLDYTKQKFLLEKENLISNLTYLEAFDFGNIEKQLEPIDKNLLKFSIFADDSLVFWNEKYNENLRFDDTLGYSFGEIYFLNSGINTYLTVKDTFSINGNTYELNLYKVVEKHYRLNSDFFQKVNLTEDLTRKTGVEINIDYYAESQFTKDGRKESIAILNNKNNKIGTLTFLKPGRENSVSAIENTISTIQGILTLIGFLLLGLVVNSELLKNNNKALNILFILLYLFILRYLFIFIDFPQNLFSSNLLSDTYYYSNFGKGIAKSPIDLLLTLLFFFIIIFLCFRYTVNFIKRETTKKIGIISASSIIILLIFLYLISLRGIGAVIRGTVFDTSLRYFQSTSISLTLPHLIMHFNILLLGLISLIGSVTIIVWILQIWKRRKTKINTSNYFYLFLFILIGIISIAFVQNTPQLNFAIKTVHLILVLFGVYLILNLDLKEITKTIIFFVFASIFSIASLLFYNSELLRILKQKRRK